MTDSVNKKRLVHELSGTPYEAHDSYCNCCRGLTVDTLASTRLGRLGIKREGWGICTTARPQSPQAIDWLLEQRLKDFQPLPNRIEMQLLKASSMWSRVVELDDWHESRPHAGPIHHSSRDVASPSDRQLAPFRSANPQIQSHASLS